MDIYYDSLTEASWFASLNPAFAFDRNEYFQIKRRGCNPELVEEIIKYDKPDIIVINGNKPILVIEITSEVPTGHNVGQRFARLVRAIELGIPTIYYFPYDAKKHGSYAGICNLNIRLLKAAEKMYAIHNTPLLCVNWPTDSDGEIIVDGTENEEMIELLNSYVQSGFNKHCRGMLEHMQKMKYAYNRRLEIRPSYAELPNSVKKMETLDFLNNYQIDHADDSFIARPYTYVYEICMTPDKCKRQDPYTGTAFIYDYLVCRTGPRVGEKANNLVFYFPYLTTDLWLVMNPYNPSTKSCNWYLTVNMMLFIDGHLTIRR